MSYNQSYYNNREKDFNAFKERQDKTNTPSKTAYIIDTPYKTMTILDDYPKIKIKSKNRAKQQ